MQLRVAQIVPDTEAEGPGKRFALWVQGCTLHCPGCCNPEMFAPDKGGTLVEVADLASRMSATPGIEGISVLGGEPFQQPEALAELCALVRASGLSVMIYTGYTLSELKEMSPSPRGGKGKPGIADLLANTDLLVDGRYDRTRPEAGRRRWIGSSNQVMHFLTPRYAPTDPRFTTPNTIELRFVNGQLTINGWPQAADAMRKP
ncbi:MAG: 4Fe-4S single cluster domain-containing protein [Archangium sp.]|nr:4Fe-4S single cluster domain-containing protein [Archangium sp.]